MTDPSDRKYDLAVIGAGSGGIGAAMAAARLGLSVVLAEKSDTLGGTAVVGGVHVWQHAVGGTGLPFEIYRRLKRIPNATGIVSYDRHICWHRDPNAPPFPGGESVINSERCYADTLLRHGARSLNEDQEWCQEHWHGVAFEPEAYVQVVEEMLAETGNCRVLRNAELCEVDSGSGQVSAVRLRTGEEVVEIEADAFVDGTGDGILCSLCGCEMMVGQEAKSRFDEPHAPEEPIGRVNGVTLIYRITRTDQPSIQAVPDGVPTDCWWRDQFPVACCTQYPCGDYNMNMLPSMNGSELMGLGYQAAYAECRRRVFAHWHHAQNVFPEFQGYRLTWIAPELGVRETRRVLGEYVLTENDLRAGLSEQTHADIVAISDHALDSHGYGGCGELTEPYGVPYRCLIPRGFTNLLVACRGSSFSALAASSCRLSRTMMELGQAAGIAVALGKQLQVSLPQVPADALQAELRRQHVQLEWPTSDELREYLTDEDSD